MIISIGQNCLNKKPWLYSSSPQKLGRNNHAEYQYSSLSRKKTRTFTIITSNFDQEQLNSSLSKKFELLFSNFIYFELYKDFESTSK